MGVSEARRAKEDSPGREPWVRIVNWRAPERGESLSQGSRPGLSCDAPPGLGLRKNRRGLRRKQGTVIQQRYFCFSARAANTSSLCLPGLTFVHTCAIFPLGSIRNVLREAIPLAPRDPYSSTTFLSVSDSRRKVRLSLVQNCWWLSALSTLTPTITALCS